MKTIIDKVKEQVHSEKVTKIITMTFRVDEDTHKKFEHIAKKLGISKNKIFIKLIRLACEENDKKK